MGAVLEWESDSALRCGSMTESGGGCRVVFEVTRSVVELVFGIGELDLEVEVPLRCNSGASSLLEMGRR